MSQGPFGEDLNMRTIQVPRPQGRIVALVVVAIVAFVVISSSFYTVDPEEIGVVMRFGKFVRDTDPGLHFKLPAGIETVEKVPIQRQKKVEFGFRTREPGIRTQYTTAGFTDESLMLTGDLNAAVVDWVVQYRITDPFMYLFKVRDVDNTFRAMTEAVMRKVVGDRTVNEVLTIGRQEVADLIEVQLQELCEQYEIGIKVDQVVLQDVNPPDPVKPSFNEVNEAQQEREKLINEAQSEYNRVIPRALGEAQQTIQVAEGYALDRVNRAEGEANRFASIFDAYRLSPEVTRKRIYLETMGEVLPKVKNKIIVDGDLKGVLPLLNLNPGGGE